MVATYIEELLASNNRVIVPNFGAFLVRATSKSKDANTLEEKLKDIYFSPFLKFNDELLEKHIARKEGVTKEEAAEKIKEFIEKVKKELDEDKPFIIKDFGRFESDKQGKVQFITVAKKEKETPASKTTQETTNAETTKKAPPVKKPETTKPSEKVTEDKPKTEEQKPAPAAKKETKAPESKLKEYQDDKKESVSAASEKEKSALSSKEKKPVYSYRKEKKSVNKGLVWSIAIGLPVAAIFIWGVLNFNTVKKVFYKEKQKTEKVTKTKDSKKATKKIQQQEMRKEGPQKEKPTDKTTQAAKKNNGSSASSQKETKPTPPQKKYYIIAGSFKNERYAVSFMNKLKAEGYNAEKLAERNGMHAVSYSSFSDKQKALAEYKFLSQEKDLQTWILYY